MTLDDLIEELNLTPTQKWKLKIILDIAINSEREECAEIAYDMADVYYPRYYGAAIAIRERGKK